MENLFETEKFLLEPIEFYDPAHLTDSFSLEEGEEVATIELPQFNAILSYATTREREGQAPSVYKLISLIKTIESHNKIIIHVNKAQGLLYIVAAEGQQKLILLNSFKISEAADILYFISIVAKQAMFNPPITTIYSCDSLSNEEIHLIERYFKKVTLLQ